MTIKPKIGEQKRFVASAKEPTKDMWRSYRMGKAELPGAILERLREMEGE
jgi:hypothetical protein